jgi:hypothetical protein
MTALTDCGAASNVTRVTKWGRPQPARRFQPALLLARLKSCAAEARPTVASRSRSSL